MEKHRNYVARNASQSYECKHSTTLLARRTPFSQAKSRVLSANTTIKQKSTEWCFLALWSKCGGSNSGPHGPEQIRHRFLTTFVYFLVLFSLKTMLSDALVRTVSTQSKSVDGQRCGQVEFSSEKPSRDYSKLIP